MRSNRSVIDRRRTSLDERDHVLGLLQHLERRELVVGRVGDHDVRLVARRPERVRAVVDTDEHRVLLPDEGLDPGELGLPVVTAHDHDDRPTGEVGGGARHSPAVQQQVLLAAEELGAVVGEALQLGVQAGAGRLELVADDLGVDEPTDREAVVAVEDLAVVHPQPGAVLDTS